MYITGISLERYKVSLFQLKQRKVCSNTTIYYVNNILNIRKQRCILFEIALVHCVVWS